MLAFALFLLWVRLCRDTKPILLSLAVVTPKLFLALLALWYYVCDSCLSYFWVVHPQVIVSICCGLALLRKKNIESQLVLV